MRVVVDVSVFISAYAFPSKSGKIGASRAVLDLWIGGRFELVSSPALVDELSRKLIDKGVGALQTAYILGTINDRAAPFPDGTAAACDHCRDPEDTYLVTLARTSEANWIVSNDRDLLDMTLIMRVGAPRAFLEAWRAEHR